MCIFLFTFSPWIKYTNSNVSTSAQYGSLTAIQFDGLDNDVRSFTSCSLGVSLSIDIGPQQNHPSKRTLFDNVIR